MEPKPLELRRWFIASASIAGYVIATACLAIVWHALPDGSLAVWALLVMYLGAGSGLILVFGRWLPIVLVRLWPSLDT